MKRALAANKLAEDGDSSELEFLENKIPYAVDATVMDAYKDAEKELKDLRKGANEMDPKEYKAEQLRIMSDFNRTYNDARRGQ
jgi:septation ring formation regulator EzrA